MLELPGDTLRCDVLHVQPGQFALENFATLALVLVAVLVANSTPLNQFIARNPDYFFGSPVEQGRINPDNLQILVNHIKCAAFELPFTADESFGGENLVEILRFLEDEKFRLEQEIPAHRVEYRTFCFYNKDRNEQSRFLRELGRRLSAPMYGGIITTNEAMKAIR